MYSTELEKNQKIFELAGKLFIKESKIAQPVFSLSGRLYLSESGWLLLNVPNGMVKGMFDALDEPGLELPTFDGKFNAHISVMRPEELESIGGPGVVTERGHMFRYNVNKLKAVEPDGWDEVSKAWILEVYSPELQTLRKTYGLPALPKYPFHITIAIRRKGILYTSTVSKALEVNHAIQNTFSTSSAAGK